MLPQQTGELPWEEKVVLLATRSLKSSYAGIPDYRFYEANRETGIKKEDWIKAKENLIRKNLLNKAGAITLNGRNEIGNANLWQLKK